jgi:hypothetical protein
MAKRYERVRESKSLSLYDLDGQLRDVLSYLEDLKAEYGEDAYLDICQSYDDVEVELIWYRDETDVERDKRLAKARKARAAAKAKSIEIEEQERAELARLQEKYS